VGDVEVDDRGRVRALLPPSLVATSLAATAVCRAGFAHACANMARFFIARACLFNVEGFRDPNTGRVTSRDASYVHAFGVYLGNETLVQQAKRAFELEEHFESDCASDAPRDPVPALEAPAVRRGAGLAVALRPAAVLRDAFGVPGGCSDEPGAFALPCEAVDPEKVVAGPAGAQRGYVVNGSAVAYALPRADWRVAAWFRAAGFVDARVDADSARLARRFPGGAPRFAHEALPDALIAALGLYDDAASALVSRSFDATSPSEPSGAVFSCAEEEDGDAPDACTTALALSDAQYRACAEGDAVVRAALGADGKAEVLRACEGSFGGAGGKFERCGSWGAVQSAVRAVSRACT
jgi:hypothetical protein